MHSSSSSPSSNLLNSVDPCTWAWLEAMNALDEDAFYEQLDAQDEWNESEEDRESSELPDSVLLSLVQSYNWRETLARIASHPEEARAVGMQGRTPLHVACDQDAPAVVIQSLLRAYPEASTLVGTTLMNPLHITCSSQHASVQVVRVLLEGGQKIQSSMRDVDGDTPLHTACRCGAPFEVLEVLLRSNPSAVHVRDFEGLTPLLRLWVRYFVILGDDAIEGVRGPAEMTGQLGEAWRKTELLLRCAHHGYLPYFLNGVDEYGTVFRALHAASAVDCPRPIVKIAAILHPNQLEERDDQGLTPILIAARAPIFQVRDLSDKGYMLEDRIHGDNNNYEAAAAVAGAATNSLNNEEEAAGQPSVLELLVHANMDSDRMLANASCIPSPDGRLPLHWALATCKKWNEGVKALIEAYPDGLSMVDRATGLYPFMLAAINDKADITTIFEVLRLDPALVEVSSKD